VRKRKFQYFPVHNGSQRLHQIAVSSIEGDPDIGKSFLVTWLACKIPIGGKMPDGKEVPRGNVLYLSAEDDAEYTNRPRVDAMTGVHEVAQVRPSRREGGRPLAHEERYFNEKADQPDPEPLGATETDTRIVDATGVGSYQQKNRSMAAH